MSFLEYNKVHGSWSKDNKHFKLSKEFTVEDTRNGLKWVVPAGYETDGASFPPGFDRLYGGKFNPKYIEAAVVHDWYCHFAKERDGNPPAHNRTQKQVHGIFRDILKEEGVKGFFGWWVRGSMYNAVVIWNRVRNPKWK